MTSHSENKIIFRANITAATTDICFTMMPVSNALGQPVLCVVISRVETPSIPSNWVTGIDIVVTAIHDADAEEYLKKNSGVNKMLPNGPVCMIGNKEIPAYVTASPSGGITSQILANVLKYLDDLNVFPRGDNMPPPFIVLDGHNSCFGLASDFLS